MLKSCVVFVLVFNILQTIQANSGQQCHKLELNVGSGQPIFYEMPPSIEGRFFLPFTIISQKTVDLKLALKVFFGTGQDLRESNFYTITIGLQSGLAIGKLAGESRSEIILETSSWRTTQSSQGFYIRLKPRQDYFGVSLYEGEGDPESDGEPLISIKDHEMPLPNPLVYGFALMAGEQIDEHQKSYEIVQIEHMCQSALHATCIHFTECVEEGVSCIPRTDTIIPQAICDCDDDHIMSLDGRRCLENPIVLGDPCISSRQCAPVDAKCRKKDSLSTGKICKCFPNQEVSPEGRCVEEKDLGILDLRRLFRKPFWSELNPGRRPWESKTNLMAAAIRQVSNSATCSVLTKTKGSQNEATEIYPLPWSRRGFMFSVHLKGKGSIVLQIVQQRKIGPHKIIVELLVNNQIVVLRSATSSQEVQLKRSSVRLKNGEFRLDFWIGTNCQKMDSDLKLNCSFIFGQDNEETPILSHWLGDMTPVDNKKYPTHFTFMPGDVTTDVEIGAICSSTSGHECTYNIECQRTDSNLICLQHPRGICRCSNYLTWNPLQAKCV